MRVSSGQCQRKAEQCAKLTAYVETPQMRVALANVERTWLKLADQCRRLDELVEIIESPAIAPAMEIGTQPEDHGVVNGGVVNGVPAADADTNYDLGTPVRSAYDREFEPARDREPVRSDDPS
jgi:hypothetical protein